MAAPTYTWTTIAGTQTDADSPLDTTLMDGVRKNLIHLEEWLGDGYTAAKNHDHDDVNSKSVVLGAGVVTTVKIADANVTLAKLKMTRGSYGATTGGTHYITIPLNSHIASAYKAGGTYSLQLVHASRADATWASTEKSELSCILDTFNTEQFYVYWDYHVN